MSFEIFNWFFELTTFNLLPLLLALREYSALLYNIWSEISTWPDSTNGSNPLDFPFTFTKYSAKGSKEKSLKRLSIIIKSWGLILKLINSLFTIWPFSIKSNSKSKSLKFLKKNLFSTFILSPFPKIDILASWYTCFTSSSAGWGVRSGFTRPFMQKLESL